MTPGLELSGVAHSYPGPGPVLQDLDLAVPVGGCVALLGPSGSGKSTVLRLVAGLEAPVGGRILIAGRDVARVPPQRRRAALVFQQPRLFPHLDVLDNVAFAPTVAGVRRRAARELAGRYLGLVGTEHLAGRRPGTLSGGQQQRVALARALASEPDVLLLDEPFSALDPSLRTEMHELLVQLRSVVEPTILLVTHDRHEAAVLADTVAILRQGRIVQHDLPEVLHARPVDLEAHRFLGGLNAVTGQVEAGVHVSSLGRLEVGAGVPEGPGTLVLRQESLSLCAAEASPTVTGSVVGVRTTGARAEVRVEVGGVVLVVETADRLRPGDVTGVVVPRAARHVVASGRPAPEQVERGVARQPAGEGV